MWAIKFSLAWHPPMAMAPSMAPSNGSAMAPNVNPAKVGSQPPLMFSHCWCHCSVPLREKIDQSVTPFSAALFSALMIFFEIISLEFPFVAGARMTDPKPLLERNLSLQKFSLTHVMSSIKFGAGTHQIFVLGCPRCLKASPTFSGLGCQSLRI